MISVTAAWVYVVAWVGGLMLFGAGPGSSPSDAELDAFYRDHRWSSSLQTLLVHGVAGVALVVVAIAIRRRRILSDWWLAAAIVAGGLSIAQFGAGEWRSNWADHPAAMVHLIDRVDGAKMLALAAVVVVGTVGLVRSRTIGRPLTVIGG